MKELAEVIANVVKSAQQAGEVHNLSFSVAVPSPEGFKGMALINLVATEGEVLKPLAESVSVKEVKEQLADEAPEKLKGKRGRSKSEELHFDKQPIEIAAALLALYGPLPNYAQEEIAAAGELLASGTHGNVEEMAGNILAVFQDCNQPKMLNSALVSIGGMVVEWWDDLADHAARVAFFEQLKNSKPHERDTIEPVIYWKSEDGEHGEFNGKGQLAEYQGMQEISGGQFEQIDAKEYAKLQKSAPKVDFEKLRNEGLALVRQHAAGNRDAITDILTKFEAIADTGKPSWGAIKDDKLADAVAALKAL